MNNVKATLLVLSVVVSGCGSGSPSQEELNNRNEFDYSGMMANYADNILLPSYNASAQGVSALSTELDNYCAAIGSDDESAALNSVQQSWQNLSAQWQAAELTWVGPLLENNGALRNSIYSYATNTPFDDCATDLAVMAHDADPSGYDIASRSVSVRGLGALEYLIFEPTLASGCSTAVPQAAVWNGLPQIERKVQRCAFAQIATDDLNTQINTLINAWHVDAGNYRSLFINRNNAGEFLSELSDALFYLEKEIKDFKLGASLGLVGACTAQACPEKVESPYAEQSAQAIAQNLRAFKVMVDGAGGLGFDDIIAKKGQADFTQSLLANTDDAIAMADALVGESLLDVANNQLANNGKAVCAKVSDEAKKAETGAALQPSYCALHGVLARIADQLKIDFVTIVNVDLPQRSQSDND